MNSDSKTTLLFLCMICVCVGLVITPSIVWIIIGFNHLHDECISQDNLSLSLAWWLIINGFTFIFDSLIIGVVECTCMITTCCMCNKIIYDIFGIFIKLLMSLYFFAWLVYGIFLLNNSVVCSSTNTSGTTLYNTTLAAVIIGFVWWFIGSCFKIKKRNTINPQENVINV